MDELQEERWSHISRRHAERATLHAEVLETVAQPDVVQAGDSGELLAIRLYPSTPLTRKHVVVAHRETSREDGFVIAAYLTSTPSAKRRTVWTRSESQEAPRP